MPSKLLSFTHASTIHTDAGPLTPTSTPPSDESDGILLWDVLTVHPDYGVMYAKSVYDDKAELWVQGQMVASTVTSSTKNGPSLQWTYTIKSLGKKNVLAESSPHDPCIRDYRSAIQEAEKCLFLLFPSVKRTASATTTEWQDEDDSKKYPCDDDLSSATSTTITTASMVQALKNMCHIRPPIHTLTITHKDDTVVHQFRSPITMHEFKLGVMKSLNFEFKYPNHRYKTKQIELTLRSDPQIKLDSGVLQRLTTQKRGEDPKLQSFVVSILS